MLSQLSKTVKIALRSNEEERAILRARSAVQRFPVIQWRQQMEDLHRRSITMSRNIAGAYAWRGSDCEERGRHPSAPTEEGNEWNPSNHFSPSLSQWDSNRSGSGTQLGTVLTPAQ